MFRKMAAAAALLLAATIASTGEGRADAALDECLRNPVSVCSRMMQKMETPEQKTAFARLFARTECGTEIDLGIAASSPRRMCRELAEEIDAAEKAAKEKAEAAAIAADAEAQRRAKAKAAYREPGAVDLCPPPHRMTDNGCK